MSHFFAVNELSWRAGHTDILHQVSFQLQPGEILGLIGPNGAGKSTLLKLLQRQMPPTTGSIALCQRPLASYSRKELAQWIAVVGQHSEVFNGTVLDGVRLGLLPHKAWYQADNSGDEALLLAALQKVGMAAKAGQAFMALSGGEQQRVLIARALVQQAKILLLDEPTNHLDVHYQHQVLALLRELGVTVVISIHDLNLAATYCDRILLLDQGQCIACGPPAKVLQQSLLSQVFQLPTVVDQHPLTGKVRVSFALDDVCLQPPCADKPQSGASAC
jgi:iron complex transport system ATP-binding protein